MRGMARVLGMTGLAAVLWAALCMMAPLALADDEADPYAQAIAVDLADGDYSVDLAMEGGSGRASLDSPAKLTVQDGHAVITVRWSSPNYDYMLVDGVKYLNQTKDVVENSVFTIPVLALDEPFEVVGDTTAMSTPHEVDYTISLDSTSIVEGAPADALAAGGDTSPAVQAPADASSADVQAPAPDTSADVQAPADEGGVPLGWVIAGVIIAVAVIGLVIGVIRGRKTR